MRPPQLLSAGMLDQRGAVISDESPESIRQRRQPRGGKTGERWPFAQRGGRG
jgi:hypothetical protein